MLAPPCIYQVTGASGNQTTLPADGAQTITDVPMTQVLVEYNNRSTFELVDGKVHILKPGIYRVSGSIYMNADYNYCWVGAYIRKQDSLGGAYSEINATRLSKPDGRIFKAADAIYAMHTASYPDGPTSIIPRDFLTYQGGISVASKIISVTNTTTYISIAGRQRLGAGAPYTTSTLSGSKIDDSNAATFICIECVTTDMNDLDV